MSGVAAVLLYAPQGREGGLLEQVAGPGLVGFLLGGVCSKAKGAVGPGASVWEQEEQ